MSWSRLVVTAIALSVTSGQSKAQSAAAPEAAADSVDTLLTVRSDAAPPYPSLRTLLLPTARWTPGQPPWHSPSNTHAVPPPVHRALFCRFDDDLDAKKIPLRVRLGDLETVNRKEGKPGW